MKLIKVLSATLIAFSCLLFSCKKTVEGENQNWDRNSQMVNRLTMQYPQFKNPIEQQYAKAKTQWEAALQQSNEEQKIKDMAAANSLISYSFIGSLGDIESQKTKLRDLQSKMRNLSGNADVSYRASSFITESSNTIQIIDMTLSRGANSPEDAQNVLQILKQTADGSIKNGNDIIAYANEQERKRNEEKNKQNAQTNSSNSNTNTTNSQNTNTNTPPPAASVTCGKCGTVNTNAGSSCNACTAPL
jgi:hypothetical protein